jgi:hypothetical protein
MLGWVVRMTMAGVDNARRLSWDIWIIVAFGIIRQNYFRDMDSWLVKSMNRDYLVFLGVFCVVEEIFRIAYYPCLGSCVVLEPLEVFGWFWRRFLESLF